MKKALTTLLMIQGMLLVQPALAADAQELYQSKVCVACHAIDTQLVGPAYTDVAAEYAGQDDAVDILVDSIKNGSEGKWGSVPMPANNVTDEEARILAEWILEQE